MAGNLSQYPSPPGNKNQVVRTFAGPSSYTQVTPGASPSGGIVVNASDVGLVEFDHVTGGTDGTGTYEAVPIFDKNPQGAKTSVRFLIRTLATGAETAGQTNLSAIVFRMWAFGF